MTTVIAFPAGHTHHEAGTDQHLTLLEGYLANALAAPVDSLAAGRVHAAASRVRDLLALHEIEVLTDPRHSPGARRPGTLWNELDRMSAPCERASIRAVAREVIARLADHEATLLLGCLGAEHSPAAPRTHQA